VDVANRLRAILQLVRQTSGVNVRDKVAAELQDFGDTLGRKAAATEPPTSA